MPDLKKRKVGSPISSVKSPCGKKSEKSAAEKKRKFVGGRGISAKSPAGKKRRL